MWRLVLAGVLVVGCKFEPRVQTEEPKDSSLLPDLVSVLEPLRIDASAVCRPQCGDKTCCITAGENAQNCALDCATCSNNCTVCPTSGCCKEKCQNCSPACTTCNCLLDVSGSAEMVNPKCLLGASCVIDCTGTLNCQSSCTGGADCEVDCAGTSGTCTVDCLASSCSIRCVGASGTCDITNCVGGVKTCPNGVKVCGRSCP